MKILLDFTSRAAGGGVTFLNNFIPNLAKLRTDHLFYLFTPAPLSYSLPANFTVIPVQARFPYEIWKILWYQITIKNFILKENIDLFYGSTGISPLTLTCPSILTLQNLWPFLSNEAALPIKILKYLRKKYINKSSQLATLIHFASFSAFQEHIRLGLNIDQKKAKIIHFGIGNIFFKIHDSLFLEEYLRTINLHNKEFILFVGNIFRHKNIIDLIKAYSIMKDKIKGSIPYLVIAGRLMEDDYMNELNLLVEKLLIKDYVIFLGEINYDNLPLIYRSAKLFVFPSVLETFGFPMIEAMACQVPLIASDIPIAHELCGEASLYFPPNDPEKLASLMLNVMQDNDLRKSLVEKGVNIAKTFTWEDTALKMLTLFSEAYSKKHAE
ncbi:MAG: glycosyltransferase family 1 protein [Desulfobaccales bacterium]